MGSWEYTTVLAQYDGKKHKDWILPGTNGPAAVGMPAILEWYGRRGWELVGLVAERSEIYTAFAKWVMEPMVYRATFKRPAGA